MSKDNSSFMQFSADAWVQVEFEVANNDSDKSPHPFSFVPIPSNYRHDHTYTHSMLMFLWLDLRAAFEGSQGQGTVHFILTSCSHIMYSGYCGGTWTLGRHICCCLIYVNQQDSMWFSISSSLEIGRLSQDTSVQVISNPPPKLVMVAYLSKSEITRRLEKRHPGSTSGSYPAPSADYIAGWFCQFEQDLRECNIPPAQYQATAFMVLLGTIRVGMMVKRRQEPCNWDVFKNVIVEAVCCMY